MLKKFLANRIYRLSALVLFITINAGLSWSGISFPTILSWLINFITIYTLLQFKREYRSKNSLLEAYFLWLLVETFRGAFIAENYWEWKQLISGFLSLSLPLFIYAFIQPYILQKILSVWIKIAIPLFIIFLPILSRGAYHFYLGPIFLLGCFIPILPSKWRIVIGGLLVIMLFISLGARSQVIKSAVVLLVALGIYYRPWISINILKIVHWICYVAPIILLTLGISGTFNIFEDLASNKGKYVEYKVVGGKVVKNDLSADTRTFIYQEVITSALKHHYVIWGRTPARGNDSMAFGKYTAEELKTGKYERHANEVCHPNVFTWLGLIGVVLYSLIYLQSSYLAVYKSNNIYIKYLGCFIAFRWAYGWVEDFNSFDIANLSLWMIIAIGLSKYFRKMNNVEFRLWIRSIFDNLINIRYRKIIAKSNSSN